MDWDERGKALDDFYEFYWRLKKKYNLRFHCKESLYDDARMDIWRFEGEQLVEKVCGVKEEKSADCYRKALNELKYFAERRRKSMEGIQQVTLDQWTSWKEDIREKLKETAGNFVYIGFRLKQIRDSGMLGGAADIFEFALNEYGLGKSTTSRFIAINTKFSEGGNSVELRAEYKAIGSSKLAEMLTLPDAECQLITERTTVKEIRELKSFGRQQASEEEGEREEGRESEERQLSPFKKCLVDYFKDKADMLNAVIRTICPHGGHGNAIKKAAEIMNPSGYGTHKKGICFMFMYDYHTGVKAKILTDPEPMAMAWGDVLAEVWDIFKNLYEDGECDIHKAYYGEPEKEAKKADENEPQNTEETQKNTGIPGSVATSQQKPKTEKNRDVPEGKKREKNGGQVVAGEESNTPEEEQIQGQMSVEDYQEILPANYQEIKEEPKGAEDGTNEAADGTNEAADGTNEAADGQEPDGGNDGKILSDTGGGSNEAANDNVVSGGLGTAGDTGASGEVPEPDIELLWWRIELHKNRVKDSVGFLFVLKEDIDEESVQKAYDDAVGLAAVLEQLLIAKKKERKNYNG